MLSGKPTIESALPRFQQFVTDTILIAHNAAFDMRMLQMAEASTGIRFINPVLDTLLLSALVHPSHKSHLTLKINHGCRELHHRSIDCPMCPV